MVTESGERATEEKTGRRKSCQFFVHVAHRTDCDEASASSHVLASFVFRICRPFNSTIYLYASSRSACALRENEAASGYLTPCCVLGSMWLPLAPVVPSMSVF